MRHTLLLTALLALTACNKGNNAGGGNSPVTLQNDDQKALYAVGLFEGRRLAVFDLTPEELAIVHAGMRDQLTGAKPQVSLDEWGPKIDGLVQKRMAAKGEKEKAKGKAAQDKAAAEKGARKLESGVVYLETQAGTGAQPTAQDTVKVNYRGTTTDGTEFDSSFKRNEPATFPLGGVIRCWTEGVAQMKVGGKAKLTCPPETAYGERPPPGSPIPPNGTLTFEVELLEIVKQPEMPALDAAPQAAPPAGKQAPAPKK